jgi:PAS domain S-box-containing protein
MKIKTQISISLVVFAILAGLIIFSVYSSNNQLQEINKKEEIINQIRTDSFELYYLENDYLLYGGTRPVEQWNSRYNDLDGLLKELKITDPSQQDAFNQMLDSHAEIKDTFSSLLAVTGPSQGTKTGPASQELREFTTSTLTGQTQTLVFSSSELLTQVRSELLATQQRNTLIISFSLAMLMVFVLLNYLIINRSVLRSISTLRRGTEKIGSGDLNTKIETQDNDELGDLSRAFNAMTSNLKTVLISKSELEKEIAERTKAEEAFRTSERRFRVLFEEALDGICLADAKTGIIIDCNQALAALAGRDRGELVGQPQSILHPPYNDDSAYSPTFRQHLGDKKGQILETQVVTKTGIIREVEIKANILTIQGQEIVQGIFRDITERKRAEEALRKSEAILNDTGLIARIGGWEHDLVTGKATWTKALYEIDELGSGPPPGTAEHLDQYPSPYRAILETAYRRAVETGTPFDLELQVYTAKKHLIWGRVIGRPVMEHGRCVRMVGAFQDITERKRAYEAIRESEERFRIVAQNITDVIYEWDLKERVDWYGDIDGLMGYPAGGFPRTLSGWAASLHPEDKDRVWKNVEDQLKGIAAYDVEYRVKTKDGGWRMWSARGTVIKDERGEPHHWIGSITDVTERKRADEALWESEQKFRDTVTSLDEGYYSCTLDGLVLDHNPAFNRILGIDIAKDMKGAKLPDFWQNPTDRKEYLDELMSRGFIRNYVINAKTLSNEKIVVLANSHLVKDETGRPVRIDGTYTDFTDRKRMEDELARSNKELQQFAYISSHDLQEPLRMISSFVQILEKRYKGKLDQDADEFIGYIVEGTSRMQRMIQDLLTFSRVQTRGAEFAPVDTNKVFEKTVSNLQMMTHEAGAVVTKDELPTVMGDETQLIQLFQNLIDNAIKFRRAEETPTVHISAQKKGIDWEFSVNDNGIGIDPQYFDRIFILFQRLHSREEYAGTGIGLAICMRIVERHGGRIWVESEPGKGSIFHFSLPAVK